MYDVKSDRCRIENESLCSLSLPLHCFYLQRKLRPWWLILLAVLVISALSVDTNPKFQIMLSATLTPSTLCPLVTAAHNVQKFWETKLPWIIIWLELVKECLCKIKCNPSYVAAYIESMISRLEGGLYQCSECGYQSRHSHDVRRHIEAKHIMSTGYYCPKCPEILKNKIALKNHLARAHKKSQLYWFIENTFCPNSLVFFILQWILRNWWQVLVGASGSACRVDTNLAEQLLKTTSRPNTLDPLVINAKSARRMSKIGWLWIITCPLLIDIE